ncbi:MAG TPA: hypothetical protein DEV93_17805 [Chloroflexi bacterium]|jgi:hypothetical protein|nr:hypothetical protein [Chloroflexota bacterium]
MNLARRALICLLAATFAWPVMPASADSSFIAIPTPAIPGAAQLPGPVADAATPSDHMGILNVSPIKGIPGTPVTISGSGLPAKTAIVLTWSTANVTWVVDPQPETVDYHGRSVTHLAVVLNRLTTDGSGAFHVSLRAPVDFGGLHDLYAVVGHTQVAHGGFLIQRSFSINPTSGPIGTPITITYRGIGSSLYEGGGALLYDNHYVGALTANWTRGTAQVVIRAAGQVGNHVVGVEDAITYPYLNIQQTTIPWAHGFSRTFRVTRDAGRPVARLDWPAQVTPTLDQRTTLEEFGQVPDGSVRLQLSATAVPVNHSITVRASGLTSSARVSLVWSTVVGSRINCTSICWTTVSQPLSEATPTNGVVATTVTSPDGLGGWHAVQMLQAGKLVAEQPIFLKENIVGSGVSALTVKEGQLFTVHLKGIGWTQLDNTRGVTYDNSYIGYGCGFSSNGDMQLELRATGGAGTHLIDIYPVLFTETPSFANTPYGMAPMLTYARDLPGLAMGYQLPAARLAITVVN